MTPRRDRTEPDAFLPLSPADFEVLLQLAERPLHGYGLVQAAEQTGDITALDLGSLYRIINRMLDDGLIEEVDAPSEPQDGRVRRYYGATSLGRRVARAEAARLRTLLASPRVLRLAGRRGGPR